jgi:ankyrin repeat protein
MAATLPPNPSIENLKKQAKTLKKAWQQADPAALQRIRAAHPHYANMPDDQLRTANLRLTDCQLVLAREAGFASWRQLKTAIESARKELPDQFVTIACLCHDDPHYDHRTFHARAHEMLRQNPWLAEANIWSAATAGHAAAVQSFLDRDASLANRPGPHGWVPLICACYSRVEPVQPTHSTFDAAKVLLDHGADPNAFTMKGNADERLSQRPRRFTALTGLFGGGSTGLANQPPHPRWHGLAELLLQRGANPADEQALSINAPACLEMLLRYGLSPDAKAPNGITLMGRELANAARNGHRNLVRLLLAYRARTDEKVGGKTPWEHAISQGNKEIALFLQAAGAPTVELDEVQRFVSLCLEGIAGGARAMLLRIPDLLARAPKDLVRRAVHLRRPEALAVVLDLGFDPNLVDDNAPIHMAGDLDANEELLRILLAGGASLTLRDPWYDSTGVGWADFFKYNALRDRLLNEPGICLLDALDYGRLDRVPGILARDPGALERPFAQCISRDPKPDDWQTPLLRAVGRGQTEAVGVLLANGADVKARHPDGRSILQVARDKGFTEIASLLEQR